MANTAVLFRAAPKRRADRPSVSGDRLVSAGHDREPNRRPGRLVSLLGAIRAANADIEPAIFVGPQGTPFRTGAN